MSRQAPTLGRARAAGLRRPRRRGRRARRRWPSAPVSTRERLLAAFSHAGDPDAGARRVLVDSRSGRPHEVAAVLERRRLRRAHGAAARRVARVRGLPAAASGRARRCCGRCRCRRSARTTHARRCSPRSTTSHVPRARYREAAASALRVRYRRLLAGIAVYDLTRARRDRGGRHGRRRDSPTSPARRSMPRSRHPVARTRGSRASRRRRPLPGGRGGGDAARDHRHGQGRGARAQLRERRRRDLRRRSRPTRTSSTTPRARRHRDPARDDRDARRSRSPASSRRCGRSTPNLRPEGKDGALVRTLDSHLQYYDRWAKSWEFQALLKARPLAGDRRARGALRRRRRAEGLVELGARGLRRVGAAHARAGHRAHPVRRGRRAS